MPKFALLEREGWEKWILLSLVKKIPFSSKLRSPHQPGSSDRECSHSMQRLFFPMYWWVYQDMELRAFLGVIMELNVPTVTTWVNSILATTQQNSLVSLPVFFGKMTFSYTILPEFFFSPLIFWAASGTPASLFAVQKKKLKKGKKKTCFH